MYKLHAFAQSGNTYKVALLLQALRQPWTPIHLPFEEFAKGIQRSDTWRQDVNPMGEIPVLEVGDRKLTQSAVILLFLSEKHGAYGGQTEDERLEVMRWMFMNAAHLSPAVARIFAHTIRLPKEKRNPQIVEESRGEAARSLVALEDRLANGEFLTKQFGIADVSVALTLAAAPMLGISFAEAPHVATWLARVEGRPAWKRVHG